MKKILHITSSLRRRGTETYVMNLFRQAREKGYKFDFLIFDTSKEGYYDEAVEMGAKVYFATPRKSGVRNYIRGLESFFSEHKGEYSAVHYSGCNWSTIAPIAIAKKYGIPTRILHCHSSSSEGWHNILLHKINKRVAPYVATHFLACSKEAAEWGFGHTSAMSKAKVALNGINVAKYAFDRAVRKDVREAAGITDSTTVWGHVGGLESVKNHEFLLHLFRRNLEKNRDSRLWIIGSGSLEDKLKRLADELGVMDKVTFWGQRDDVARLMQGMDVFVMPSHFEGLPFVMLEAQASGLPVVASDVVSPEAVVLKSTHTESLDAPLDRWIADIDEATAQADRDNASEALKGFDLSNVVRPVLDIYSET